MEKSLKKDMQNMEVGLKKDMQVIEQKIQLSEQKLKIFIFTSILSLAGFMTILQYFFK